jgi:hypothetical protein
MRTKPALSIASAGLAERRHFKFLGGLPFNGFGDWKFPGIPSEKGSQVLQGRQEIPACDANAERLLRPHGQPCPAAAFSRTDTDMHSVECGQLGQGHGNGNGERPGPRQL